MASSDSTGDGKLKEEKNEGRAVMDLGNSSFEYRDGRRRQWVARRIFKRPRREDEKEWREDGLLTYSVGGAYGCHGIGKMRGRVARLRWRGGGRNDPTIQAFSY